MNTRHLLLLLGIFSVTIAIRWPNLGRPMGKHHEFCTATALRVLTVWEQEGIATMGFNPATNFKGAANKYINNHASGSGQMVDTQGNYYYVSHPPLAYYLPYAVFRVLHIEPGVLALQVFNLFINLLCGLGIYLLARCLLPDEDWVGALAAMIYWFIPATLWFQSNVYMSDMMAQPFYIAALFAALEVLKKQTWPWVIGLGLMCFLGTYTTWFGVLVAVSLGLGFLWMGRKQTFLWKAVPIILLSQIFALSLMAWQYSHIAGWDAYLAELGQRFALRGSGGDFGLNFWVLTINYGANYGPILVVAALSLLYLKKLSTGLFKPFLWLSFLPILLMHLLLSNYSGHDFTTLYLAVPLSVLLAIASLQAYHARRKELLAVAVITVLSMGPLMYSIFNPYGAYSYNGEKYSQQYEEAQLLKQEPADAVLFVIGGLPSPEALWYARRNVKRVETEAEALQFLQQHTQHQGILFERPQSGALQKVKTLSLSTHTKRLR